MLRLIKWSYNLGIKNERHRIAQYLASAQARRYDNIRAFEDELGMRPVESKNDATKRKIAKRQQQAAVDKEVIDIIDGIFHGEEKYERGASFMFPEGDK